MSGISVGDLLFFVIAAMTVISAAGVAFSSNIVYSAFSLMGALMGVAGLYVFLAADFVAVVQVLIYVGGILVLMLFAVMLTHRIADVRVSNRSVGRLPGLAIIGCVGVVMGKAALNAPGIALRRGHRAPRPMRSATASSMSTCCPSSWRRSCCWPP